MADRSSYTIEHDGVRYEVEAPVPDRLRTARLFADGAEVDEQQAKYWESASLTHDDTRVDVRWNARNRVSRCELVEIVPSDDDKPVEEKPPLEPPPGTRAAKLARLQRERPGLYASRHVSKAVAEVAVALLGLGALFNLVLPRINWGFLPDISRPDLPNLPGVPLPHITMPEWLVSLWQAIPAAKYWLPIVIVIAIGVAATEVDRRRKRQQARAERQAARAAHPTGDSDDSNDSNGVDTPAAQAGRGTDG